jgi:branched-chain amino acid transport system permease protein
MFFQQLFNGLVAGSCYSLVALGFTLIFGVMNVLTFAHPEVFMIGAFTGFFLVEVLNADIVVAVLGGMVASAALGVVINQAVIKQVKKGGLLAVITATVGVSVFLQNFGARIFTTTNRHFPSPIQSSFFNFAGIQMSAIQLICLGIAATLMTTLIFYVDRTKMGRSIRAAAENAEAANFLGVNVNFVSNFTTAIASGLAGAAGVLIGILYGIVNPYMGIKFGIKGFFVLILGGVGSIEGAMVGGLILGVAEAMVTAYVSAAYRDAVAFGLLVLILIIRPTGLFQQRIRTK